jgi:signal transduction histidine kinase
VESIHSIIDDIHLSGLVEIKFTHDQENDLLSPGKKVTVFRIIQEQLKNILKYSKAKKVDIFLQRKDNDLQLIIRDNGVGFDPRQITKGIGLSNIHDRVRFYNGKVELNSSPGKGCMLTVTIPFID